MCTTPNETCLRSFFLKVFFLPFFSGAAAAPPAAAGFAISSVSSGQWPVVSSFLPAPRVRFYWQLTTEHWQLGFSRRLLLLRDRSLTRSLARPGVGMRPLSPHWQIAAVPKAAIGADFNEPLNAHGNFFAQIAFHQAFAFNHLANAIHFVLTQVLDLFHRVHLGFVENARGPRLPDSIDVSQRNECPLVTRKIDACNSCHSAPITPVAACVSNSRKSPAPHPCGG